MLGQVLAFLSGHLRHDLVSGVALAGLLGHRVKQRGDVRAYVMYWHAVHVIPSVAVDAIKCSH